MAIFRRIYNSLSSNKKFFLKLKNVLGFSPNNISLYKLAFSIKTSFRDIKIKDNNERLEYLGDAILGAVIAEFLFKKFPYKEEGFLTEMRSKIVSRENLNRLGYKIGLEQFILEGGIKGRSIYGDIFEALIGAIYLDLGYNKVKHFIVNRILKHHIDIDYLELTETNFKSKLIEWAQKGKKTVKFELIEEISNGGNKLFKVCVLMDDIEMGVGIDFSKRRAEQIAAEEAWKSLSN